MRDKDGTLLCDCVRRRRSLMKSRIDILPAVEQDQILRIVGIVHHDFESHGEGLPDVFRQACGAIGGVLPHGPTAPMNLAVLIPELQIPDGNEHVRGLGRPIGEDQHHAVDHECSCAGVDGDYDVLRCEDSAVLQMLVLDLDPPVIRYRQLLRIHGILAILALLHGSPERRSQTDLLNGNIDAEIEIRVLCFCGGHKGTTGYETAVRDYRTNRCSDNINES